MVDKMFYFIIILNFCTYDLFAQTILVINSLTTFWPNSQEKIDRNIRNFGKIQKSNLIKGCIFMVFHMGMKDIGNIKNAQNKTVFLHFLKMLKSALTTLSRKAIDLQEYRPFLWQKQSTYCYIYWRFCAGRYDLKTMIG